MNTKLVHYSRDGYNGDYTYTSVCGKIVKTHQDTESSSIYPQEANCSECLNSTEFKTDLDCVTGVISGVKRRLYIESDILNADEFGTAKRQAFKFAKANGESCVERGFSEVVNFAWHDLEKTWEAVKKADEIYATSSLMPLIGGSYSGAPVIFNGMCERALKEDVTGKSVIILSSLEYIHWDMIDISQMKKAFKNNKLYMYDDEYELTPIDVAKIKSVKS